MPDAPRRGELWWVDLDPVVGSELGRKVRPAVVVSDDELNQSRLAKIVVVPSTTQAHDVPWRVEWAVRTRAGMQHAFFCCDDVRAISTERLRGRIGARPLPLPTVERIEHVLRMLLAL